MPAFLNTTFPDRRYFVPWFEKGRGQQNVSRMDWREWTLSAVTMTLVVLFACHPELRLLIPLIDVVGIDVFAVLLGAQAWGYLKPPLAKLHVAVLVPVMRRFFSWGSSSSGCTAPAYRPMPMHVFQTAAC
jgi:hypothetical protein